MNKIQNKLQKYKNKYKIGISWKSFNNRYSLDKSLDLNDFKNVLDTFFEKDHLFSKIY